MTNLSCRRGKIICRCLHMFLSVAIGSRLLISDHRARSQGERVKEQRFYTAERANFKGWIVYPEDSSSAQQVKDYCDNFY